MSEWETCTLCSGLIFAAFSIYMIIDYFFIGDFRTNEPLVDLILIFSVGIFSVFIINNYNYFSERERIRELEIFQEFDWISHPNDLNAMSGYEFEDFLSHLFESLGYDVRLTPTSYDQGADLILNKEDQIIAVQAKRYTKPVGNRAVQEIVAAIPFYGATEGWVVTTSSFTNSAINLARANNIRLLGWNELVALIKQIPRSEERSSDQKKNNFNTLSLKIANSPFITKNSDFFAVTLFALGPFIFIMMINNTITSLKIVIGFLFWGISWFALAKLFFLTSP